MPWYRSPETGLMTVDSLRACYVAMAAESQAKAYLRDFTLCSFCAGCGIERPIHQQCLKNASIKMIGHIGSPWE
jgi:hypothetical protein